MRPPEPTTTSTTTPAAEPASGSTVTPAPRWVAWTSPTRVVVAAVALLGLVVTALVLTAGDGEGSAEPMVGTAAPPLAGRTLDGDRRTLRYPPGSTTVVNVWASWCGPCREELPLLGELARRPPAPGVRVMTLNTRDGEVPARELLEELDLVSLPTVLDPEGTTAVAWGARGVPETFVVDDRGTIVARRAGVLDADWLADVLAEEAAR